MQLHLFGRARRKVHQIRGQHMFVYPKGHPIYEGHLKRFTDEELEKLRVRIAEVMQEPKYQKMAESAEASDQAV